MNEKLARKWNNQISWEVKTYQVVKIVNFFLKLWKFSFWLSFSFLPRFTMPAHLQKRWKTFNRVDREEKEALI